MCTVLYYFQRESSNEHPTEPHQVIKQSPKLILKIQLIIASINNNYCVHTYSKSYDDTQFLETFLG